MSARIGWAFVYTVIVIGSLLGLTGLCLSCDCDRVSARTGWAFVYTVNGVIGSVLGLAGTLSIL